MAEKITTIHIDEELLERGKIIAKHNRVSLSIVISTLLKDLLDGRIEIVIPIELKKDNPDANFS